MEHAAHAQPHAGSVLAFLVLALLLGAYALATRTGHAGRRWSPWRTLSFFAGIALLGLALAPLVVAFAHADLRGHMLQHLLLGMFAPLALVLGAPGTLLLRNLPPRAARAGGLPGHPAGADADPSADGAGTGYRRHVPALPDALVRLQHP
ncbi:cytochrome c oxidase assembly protein [Azotobacter sp. CWF10]